MKRIATKAAYWAEIRLGTSVRIGSQWCGKVDVGGGHVAWPLSPNHPSGRPDHGRSRMSIPETGIVHIVDG